MYLCYFPSPSNFFWEGVNLDIIVENDEKKVGLGRVAVRGCVARVR